jgi:excisionase family DNA binding protein
MSDDLSRARDDLRAVRVALEDAQRRLAAAEAALAAADPGEPELLTVGAVAQRLSLHRNTVRIMCQDGRLDGVKVGTRYRVRRESVERFAAGR